MTRVPGVAALTAGPGVTNGMSAMAAAQQNQLAAGGARRPRPSAALGTGLPAGDRPRAVRGAADPIRGDGAARLAEIPGRLDRRGVDRCASRPHSGPAFVDFPLDHVFM